MQSLLARPPIRCRLRRAAKAEQRDSWATRLATIAGRRKLAVALVGLALILGRLSVGAPAAAATITLKDGRVLEGEIGQVGTLAEDPRAQTDGPKTILLVDDNLRRIFVPNGQIAAGGVNQAPENRSLDIRIPQRVAEAGARLARVGPVQVLENWDELGRRRVRMLTERGEIDLVQGITRISPRWTQVQTLQLAGKANLLWDMRIATSTIPWPTLRAILTKRKGFDPKKFEQRIEIVKLALQSERFQEARIELESVISDFPNEEQLKPQVRALRQLHARRVIDEIKQRRKAGQNQLAIALLEQFPRDDVSGETLAEVKDLLDNYKALHDQGQRAIDQMKQCLDQIANDRLRKQCQTVYDEVSTKLNFNTLDRMADFLRLVDDPALTPEQRFSLATTAWVLGRGEGGTNLNVALSTVEARNLIVQYMTEPVKLKRVAILKQIENQEGVSPRQVAQLIAHLEPPAPTDPEWEVSPGCLEVELPLPGFDKEPPISYLAQLPPEYDSRRRYPAIVTLRGANTSASSQLDWWAGGPDQAGQRQGQAGRFGYLVISVDWCKSDQTEYEYSAREHAAVLTALRDACRRFSIDTDRVFLTGHSMGGDAAWDIGLSHPDLWAGVIPIIAFADKYVFHSWENARPLPLYVVCGELDGSKERWINFSGRVLDRLLRKNADMTVVEFQGRGHDGFSDEILRLFDWMGRKQRNFFPKEIKAAAMRPWDNFYWWIETRLDDDGKGMVLPEDWPPRRGYHPLNITGSIKGNNIFIGGVDRVTVWLSPEMVDFSKKIKVELKGRTLNQKAPLVDPDLAVLLEDARIRGERLHPFWAKIE